MERLICIQKQKQDLDSVTSREPALLRLRLICKLQECFNFCHLPWHPQSSWQALPRLTLVTVHKKRAKSLYLGILELLLELLLSVRSQISCFGLDLFESFLQVLLSILAICLSLSHGIIDSLVELVAVTKESAWRN